MLTPARRAFSGQVSAVGLTCYLVCAWSPLAYAGPAPASSTRPNILWILTEDASPHLGCYGETTIQTPHLDRLAAEGVRFDQASVTASVCSPSRSASIAGMYQTTLGAHNHRSQTCTDKGGGNTAYYQSYLLPVKSVPELFREAGYHVTNGGEGKEDYNFTTSAELYDQGDWSSRSDKTQPFFCQIQLQGGKARTAAAPQPVDPAQVILPPYYPDMPTIRQDWADYLNTWMKTDQEVGDIFQRLEEAGELDKTIIFFWSDHGISHLRGKQFLYQEGIRIPLIVRFGDQRLAGTVRRDLVQHIDIAAASLALAGISITEHIQGRNLFAVDYKPRRCVFAARDRCDETIDTIRAMRTQRYKYIRNFLSWLPQAQSNQYKDGKEIVKTMRRLYAQGELNELQSRPFRAPRPAEELYDLQMDPHETRNLAHDPAHGERIEELRNELYAWMLETRDPGLIPEPILEDLGRQYGSKYAAMQAPEQVQLIPTIISVIEAGEKRDLQSLRKALTSPQPSIRYWAATWLGVCGDQESTGRLERLTRDEIPAVRVAAALALCRLGKEDNAKLLAEHIDDDNLIVGLYAIRAMEQIGPAARSQLSAIEAARESRYEFTRRCARRLARNLSERDN